MPQHIRAEVEQQNASMRHQRMMFSQEFLDFHQNVVHRNQLLISEEFERNGREGVSEHTREAGLLKKKYNKIFSMYEYTHRVIKASSLYQLESEDPRIL